jgi:beta-1,4-mannosyl-glycoprotein beta-1,4-N-acetylglucosaminyltransferase
MIYDTFTFYNELELLEVRLHELANVVDKFVLVEATRTHSNRPKPLYFADSKTSFSEFRDKIIHIVVNDLPDSQDPWVPERFQRNCILRGLTNCRPDDLILVSDADEIPRATAVQEAREQLDSVGGAGVRPVRGLLRCGASTELFRKTVRKINPFVRVFLQKACAFYLNCVCVSAPEWRGTRMTPFRDFVTADEVRYSGRITIPDGGWHFSYMGGVERIRQKLASFAHTEFNRAEYTDPQRISELINSGQDLFGHGEQFKFFQLDGGFPRFVLEHPEKFANWIKNP